MNFLQNGTLRLFRFAGITVFLHWSWFLVGAWEVTDKTNRYSSLSWNVVEYLALFGIVLLHEFGHSLACRQVGGTAERIVLWPLGGIAFVSPPRRPGAMLWSIAAGPLVNALLFPILGGLLLLALRQGWNHSLPDLDSLVTNIFYINLIILVFNLLPIYPLDGGQILQSLLWFIVGRGRSLLIVSIIGFIGVAGMIGVAFFLHSIWFGFIAAFILLNCWGGLKQARALAKVEALPRRDGFFACPSCHAAPVIGEIWGCGQCRQPFDTFASGGVCPRCGATYTATRCPDCGALSPIQAWTLPPPVLPPTAP